MNTFLYSLLNSPHSLDTRFLQQFLLQLAVVWSFVCWGVLMMTLVIGPPVIYFRYTHKKPTSPEIKKQRDSGRSRLPVSILRPLKGLDCNIEQNLECVFLQRYHQFEIIFCVSCPDDPVIPVVRSVQARYPHIDSTLLIGESDIGVNPKVNNLMKGYDSAKYDILWVLDSNVYVDEDSLSSAMELLSEPGVGLVQQMPCGIQFSSLGSLLDAVYLNCTHARMYSVVNYLSLGSFVIGKSNIYRKSDLKELGGFERFGQYMAEDNVIGTELFNKGLRHRSSSHPAYQSLGSSSLSNYFSRRARWARVRKYTFIGPTLFEPFSECILNGILAGWAFHITFGTTFLNFFSIHCLCVFTADIFTALVIRDRQIHPQGSLAQFLGLFTIGWILREVSALPVYLWAVSGSTVVWRHCVFKLQWNASAIPIHPLNAEKQIKKEQFFRSVKDEKDLSQQLTDTKSPSTVEVNISSFSPLSRRTSSRAAPKSRYIASSPSKSSRITRSTAAKYGIHVPDADSSSFSLRSRSPQHSTQFRMSPQNEVHATVQI